MSRFTIILALWLVAVVAPPSMAADSDCHTPAQLVLRMRFADEAPHDVLLRSGLSGGLTLQDRATGRELWAASADPGATQLIAGMDAAFGASLMAVHLDGDDLHDRLYAGDRAGRLWRFELRAGARPSAWMSAVMLADLGVPGGGRGFIAAPDITRIEIAGAPPWLNIAIGTANIGAPRADHRFYVLRDSLIAATPARPLVEADLERLSPPLGINSSSAPGYYLHLGTAQVLAQALTLGGHIHYTAVESGRSLLAACPVGTLPTNAVPITVTVIRAEDGAFTADIDGDGHVDQRDPRRSFPRALPANAAVTLSTGPVGADGQAQCLVGGEPLPDCGLDTRPQRTWWRREDAD
jgi:hypothetical protein